ncbi:transposase [Nitrosovibrio sp. Nv17]
MIRFLNTGRWRYTDQIRELCRQHNVSDASFYTWRTKFGEI